MKKINIIYVTLLLIASLITSCGGGYSNAAIGKTYEFVCSEMINNCQECNSLWFIKIDDAHTATIYSSKSSSSSLKSCLTKIDYTFNSETGSIKIDALPNSNINNNCQKSFIGTWTFNSEGEKGKGFYRDSNCGFVR